VIKRVSHAVLSTLIDAELFSTETSAFHPHIPKQCTCPVFATNKPLIMHRSAQLKWMKTLKAGPLPSDMYQLTPASSSLTITTVCNAL
jgi:hypothetical protein